MNASSSYVHSWTNAERRCWEYLNKAFGTVEGISAFDLHDLPRTMPDDLNTFFMWSFSLNGGPEIVQRQSRKQIVGGAWKMSGMLDIWAATDDLAKRMCGVAIEALPMSEAEDGVIGIQRLYQTLPPSRSREPRRVLNGERAGDEVIIFHATVPMECAFYNTIAAT